jgi:hypothetical protein
MSHGCEEPWMRGTWTWAMDVGHGFGPWTWANHVGHGPWMWTMDVGHEYVPFMWAMGALVVGHGAMGLAHGCEVPRCTDLSTPPLLWVLVCVAMTTW